MYSIFLLALDPPISQQQACISECCNQLRWHGCMMHAVNRIRTSGSKPHIRQLELPDTPLQEALEPWYVGRYHPALPHDFATNHTAPAKGPFALTGSAAQMTWQCYSCPGRHLATGQAWRFGKVRLGSGNPIKSNSRYYNILYIIL